jgi:formamidopyrimidine-DNA glycosylase
MPELPEVEHFRQLLLPLVTSSEHDGERCNIRIEIVGDNHRILLTADDLAQVYCCTDVLRKGKQLCLVLNAKSSNATKYLYLHMGMTGRIRVEGRAENWGGKKLNGEVVQTDIKTTVADESFPPMYTYLIFTSNNHTAYFCDPRKFGSCYLADDLSDLDILAPDALTCKDLAIIENQILPRFANQRLGIKAVLLDQKRAVSGVGNWIADEVLYQCQMHPDQCQLSQPEAAVLWQTLQSVVAAAVEALRNESHYPDTWLFSYRWTKKKTTKDALGRTITFLTSGGRTSAIVASLQKLRIRSTTRVKTMTSKSRSSSKKTVKNESSSENSSNGRKRKLNMPQNNIPDVATGSRAAVGSAMAEEIDASTTVQVRRRSPRLKS